MSGWIETEDGSIRRETLHHMGRRCLEWDYGARAIYMVTVTLEERRPVLGTLAKNSGVSAREQNHAREQNPGSCARPETAGMSCARPETGEYSISPTALGSKVLSCWAQIPARWPGVSLVEAQLMPDHFHGILFVEEPLPRGKTLGDIVRGFKTGCREAGWAEGYVDNILFEKGQLRKMADFVRDNPRRLGVKREHPEYFKVLRDIAIALPGLPAAAHFAAIGNPFLLQWPFLAQVQCSRSASPEELAEKRSEALAAAAHGAVLVSPCLSPGEKEIARAAFAEGLPVIALRNKGFDPVYKPGGKLFETCAAGNLLLLAPAAWPPQPGEKRLTREDSCTLNRIAQLLCGPGAAEIDYRGMVPADLEELVLAALKIPAVSGGAQNNSGVSARAQNHARAQNPRSRARPETAGKGVKT